MKQGQRADIDSRLYLIHIQMWFTLLQLYTLGQVGDPQRNSVAMAEDTSGRRRLEPAGLAPLHRFPSQHSMGLTHAMLVWQPFVTALYPEKHDVGNEGKSNNNNNMQVAKSNMHQTPSAAD